MRILLTTLAAALLAAPAQAQRAVQCHEERIEKPVPFKGTHGEIFRLSDRSIWMTSSHGEELGLRKPEILLCKPVIRGKHSIILYNHNRGIEVELLAPGRTDP